MSHVGENEGYMVGWTMMTVRKMDDDDDEEVSVVA
jgi:hypothetical protein